MLCLLVENEKFQIGKNDFAIKEKKRFCELRVKKFNSKKIVIAH
jgi:hypothetical protein